MERHGSRDGQYRILSLDGGGLRAVMEAVILMRLTEVGAPQVLSVE
jgi:patatin-like phospholipase/acyl hydrolase